MQQQTESLQSAIEASVDTDAAILAILPEAENQLDSAIQAYDQAARTELSLASRLDARREQIRESADRLRNALGKPALTA